ncbi:TaqI-like C-terminal specificity domain-containing protein [Akkermansia muciniphila]|uniref:TaqI-like C-terminal specificity domain-containing protein n=1 Tax=Akkermansia muciniphila TaxID=239935 RepID=UPI0038BBBE4E
MRGRDIKRYGYNWANLWIINTHNGIKGKLPRIDVNEYPAIKAHLDQYWDTISKRADKGDTPYNLRNCAYMEDFFRPKIVYPNMTKYLPFVYDKDGYFTNQKCFIALTTTPAYLTSFFNSQLFKAIYKDLFPSLGEDRRELGKIYMEKVIVKQIDKDVEEFFANLVKAIQTEYSDELDKQLNKKIFSLYELTDSEIEWVLINNYA